MTQILTMAGLLLSEVLAFFVLGLLLPLGRKDGETSIAETVCGGFLVFSGVFEMAAFVMTWLETTLVTFFYGLSIAVAFLLALSLVLRLKTWGHRVKWFFGHLHFEPLFLLGVISVLFVGWMALLKSGTDPSHSIAVMTTDLTHNTMSIYDPLTGARRTAFEPGTLLFRWPLLGAYLSFLSGLDAVVVARTVQTALTVILGGMITYRIGYRLFDRSSRRASLFLLLVSLTECFFSTEYSGTGVLMRAGFSGDAVFANVLVPSAFLLGLAIYEDAKTGPSMWLAFFLGAAGCSMSEAGCFFTFCLILTVFVPFLLAGKKWRALPGLAGSLVLPALASAFYYFCAGIPVTL